MRNEILKYFSFLFTILLLSCGGGGDDGGGTVNPPPVINPPGKSTLSAPANNKTCETGTSISDTQSEVTFTWGASADTNTYDLRITNLNTSVAINKTALATTTTKSTLDKGVPYSWYITSKSTASTTTTNSDTWKFYLAGTGIVNYAPFPADLKIPASGSTVTRDDDGKVTFTWDGSDPDTGDTLKYTLYVDTTDGKQTPSTVLTNLTVKTASVALEPATTYYWRVKTSDGTNSSYSIVYSFKTQ
ncbi:MAG: hypothetical protein O3C01_05475 [Bacteroidetes bacterium]|nr:hypothetical protein [Bacteroidota bacterium]MDA1019117.1 hypothetical protein [Bacteroidota bacterium]